MWGAQEVQEAGGRGWGLARGRGGVGGQGRGEEVEEQAQSSDQHPLLCPAVQKLHCTAVLGRQLC